MKKISILLIGTLLFMTSCTQNMDEGEVVQKDEPEEQTSIVPSQQLAKDNYKMILPYEPSKARGVILNQVANRVDIDEMEEGLRRHSKETFDPEKYYFQEGQYLTEDIVYDWLGRLPTKKQLEEKVEEEIARLKDRKMNVDEKKIRKELQQGLNPEISDGAEQKEYRDSPRYLSHILEQNFLLRKEDKSVELAGISIGLAMKSVYRFETETAGPYYEDISKDEMMKKANEVAEKVIDRIRGMDGLENVPIMIAIFREEAQSSPVPGNFVAKTNVAGGETAVGKWESIKEEHILFPSSEGKEKYFDDHEIVKNFGNKIAEFFPNYVGVIGEGFYVDKDLQRLTIEIPIEFYGKGEVLGFTQFAYGLVQEMFKNYYDLEINITSSNNMESLIYWKAGEETPTIHIFH